MTTTATVRAELVPTLSHTRAAALILDHAEAIGLPIPSTVSIDARRLLFTFDTAAEIKDWAAWMEVTPTAREMQAPYTTVTHHGATGLALEQQLEVFAVVPVAGTEPPC